MYSDINPLVEKYQTFIDQCLACKTISEYSDMVQNIDDTVNGGLHKIILHTAHGSSEGIWALALTKDDAQFYNNDNSNYEQYIIILCNCPLFWDIAWGSFVIATTTGPNKPVAYIDDQPSLAMVNTHIALLSEQSTGGV